MTTSIIVVMMLFIAGLVLSIEFRKQGFHRADLAKSATVIACNTKLVCPAGSDIVEYVQVKDPKDSRFLIWVPIVDPIDGVAVPGYEYYVYKLTNSIVNGTDPPTIPQCVLKNFGTLQGTQQEINAVCQKQHKAFTKIRDNAYSFLIGIVLFAVGNAVSFFGIVYVVCSIKQIDNNKYTIEVVDDSDPEEYLEASTSGTSRIE